ncbi:MAG: 16S rRNA (adenine(1518)-N(6)/adenine(1519)-N(6))-dimethyltransferase RsmA [Acidobacteria bacterium]|nr:16S rRNA (adenine(1518)-N(6)/adenine(1519)-N(6))-dimethyltransferase RsmA [Acidobacteriota bacterium]
MRDARREAATRGGRARRRRYGQHFLEPAWVRRVVDAIDPAPADRFLEIGPGRGALTWALAERAARVLAVEIDRELAAGLRERAGPTVEVLTGDVLDCDLVELVASLAPTSGAEPSRLRLVGNLPYRVSAPILLQVLRASDRGARPDDAVVMLQEEMADRVTAGPGEAAYGPLAVAVWLRATAARRLRLPPGAFRPAPAVHSAVVALRFRPPARAPRNGARFDALVRSLFTQRRKQAGTALGPFAARYGLSGPEVFRRAGLDARRRPGDLAPGELVALADALPSADALRSTGADAAESD